jgi:hypothetical protein
MSPLQASFAATQSRASRDAKWELYREIYPPVRGESILDVGVSKFTDTPNENFFLTRYPYLDQVTGVGLFPIPDIAERFPGLTYVQADGRRLPFRDRQFDIVHSNAVVEHVGAYEDQRAFVHELCRVAESGFITTPNAWFPIETHSKLPLVHWLPAKKTTARLMERLGHGSFWLLSPSSFRSLFPPDVDVELHRMKLAGLTLTLVGAFRHRNP